MASLQWLQDSFNPSLLFASIFLLVLLKFIFKDKSSKTKPNLPPSPPKLPIIGNLHQLGSLPNRSLQGLAKKFGPIIFYQLGEVTTVVVSSARMAKEVMKTHDLALSSRPQIFSAKHLFYDCTDIVFSPYGSYWRHIRKICILELLSAKRVQSFSFVREQEVARLIHRIAESYPGTTNLSKMLGLYANDILCRVAFGRDFSQGGDYDRHGFRKMLEEYQELLGGFSPGDFFPSMEFIHSLTGMKSRLQHTFRRFDQFFDEVINEHLDPEKQKEKQTKDLVDVLLDIQRNQSNDEVPLTMDNVKAIILDMFGAGSDTTSAVLEWAMTELLRHPKIMKELQKEVRQVSGEKLNISEDDLDKMNYLKAVIKETLRLHTPVPLLIPRISTKDVKIMGYDIAKGTQVLINAWAIGRDPKSWEKPEEFIPERFLNNSIDYKGHDFELIPFGSGRRICPGILFGMRISELFLAKLVHKFDWSLPGGANLEDLDTTESYGLTAHRKYPLIVIASPYSCEGKGEP
ncbi:hypothetical protein PTKIN_Ptkin05aG0193100 [Pterospermum kingtungense]